MKSLKSSISVSRSLHFMCKLTNSNLGPMVLILAALFRYGEQVYVKIGKRKAIHYREGSLME